jgi:hypothetical protein
MHRRDHKIIIHAHILSMKILSKPQEKERLILEHELLEARFYKIQNFKF